MNGRYESKLKIEKSVNNIIESSAESWYLRQYRDWMFIKYEPKSVLTYIMYLRKFLLWCNKDISQITTDDINSYIYSLQKPDSDYSGTYKATIHSALKSYFNFLEATQRIARNPMRGIVRPKNKKNDQIERISLNTSELQVLLHNATQSKHPQRDKLILMTFLYTGMRCSALTEMNVGDVDIDNKVIYVIDKRNKKRVFPIDNDYINAFIALKETLPRQDRMDKPLFIGGTGRRISNKTVQRILESCSVGIDKPVSPHKLRRSYGTALYQQTGDIYLVKNALGHEDIKTTQLYIISNPIEASKKGVSIMKKLIDFSEE